MSSEDDVLAAFETHDVPGLRRLLAAGFDPTLPLRGKWPVDRLLEMYQRSARFADVPNRYLLPRTGWTGRERP